MTTNKYSSNRNLWRKTYSFKRRKPEIRTLVDSNLNVTFSYDLNKTVRHRDFFLIKGFNSSSSPLSLIGFYDEGLIFFNNTTVESGSFSFTFDDTPDAVVLTVENVLDNSNNIIVYGLEFTSNSLTIGTSAPFSGNVRYRAVYSEEGYPVQVTSSFAPTSGTFTVFASHITASDTSTYNINYNVGGTPTTLHITPWDFFNNFDNNVYIDKTTINNNNSNGTISALINNPLYFIAVK